MMADPGASAEDVARAVAEICATLEAAYVTSAHSADTHSPTHTRTHVQRDGAPKAAEAADAASRATAARAIDPSLAVSAVKRIHTLSLAYKPSDDLYRIALVCAGVCPHVCAFMEVAQDAVHLYHGCRALRALPGSPFNIASNVAAASVVTDGALAKVLACMDSNAHTLETVEHAVGAVMNLVRPVECAQLRARLVRMGVIEALVRVLADFVDDTASKMPLFVGYALLSLTRENSLHYAYEGNSTLPTVKRMMTAPQLQVRAVGTMILACLAQTFDDPADGVALDCAAVGFIVEWLAKVLDPDNKEYVGWKVEELVRALFSISATDTLKSLLVDSRAVPELLHVLETPAQHEHWAACIQALHNLVFHSDAERRRHNLAALRAPGELARLQALTASEDAFVVKHATKLVQDLEEEGGGTVRIIPGGRRGRRRSSTTTAAAGQVQTASLDPAAEMSGDEADDDGVFDVMISYSWTSQRTVLAIRDVLVQHGMRVWIDVDHMGRDLMQSMADAVERSKAIVVCCCSAYKSSPNCRREADYAAHLGKPIIVANMEHGFVPRGWLGLHVAGKIWCDFRDEDPDCFNRGIATLFKQLVEVEVMKKSQARGILRTQLSRSVSSTSAAPAASASAHASPAPASPPTASLPSASPPTSSPPSASPPSASPPSASPPSASPPSASPPISPPPASPQLPASISSTTDKAVVTGATLAARVEALPSTAAAAATMDLLHLPAGAPVGPYVERGVGAPAGAGAVPVQASTGTSAGAAAMPHPAGASAAAPLPASPIPSMPGVPVPDAARAISNWESRKSGVVLTLHACGHARIAQDLAVKCSPLALAGLARTLARDPRAFHELVTAQLSCSLFDSMALAAALETT